MSCLAQGQRASDSKELDMHAGDRCLWQPAVVYATLQLRKLFLFTGIGQPTHPEHKKAAAFVICIDLSTRTVYETSCYFGCAY